MRLATSYHAVSAYVALGYWSPTRVSLDRRLEMLVARFSAELSACQWCIARSGHLGLQAFLPADLLSQVRAYETSPAFTERERAALGLVEAVAHLTERECAAAEQALARTRRYFAESEVACLAAAAAGEHFFNPVTGAVGLDVLHAAAAEGAMPWHSIDKGIVIRGLY